MKNNLVSSKFLLMLGNIYTINCHFLYPFLIVIFLISLSWYNAGQSFQSPVPETIETIELGEHPEEGSVVSKESVTIAEKKRTLKLAAAFRPTVPSFLAPIKRYKDNRISFLVISNFNASQKSSDAASASANNILYGHMIFLAVGMVFFPL